MYMFIQTSDECKKIHIEILIIAFLSIFRMKYKFVGIYMKNMKSYKFIVLTNILRHIV